MTKQSEKDERQRFAAFIRENGGEVLPVTNQWELARFRGNGITSIIYTDAKGHHTYTGQAREALEAFRSNKPFRLTRATRRPNRKNMATVDRAIIDRDGERCFYCDGAWSDANPRTREHLVAATAGGPNHISNLFHACRRCNTEAGHLSAPEKIRLRDGKRAQKIAEARAA